MNTTIIAGLAGVPVCHSSVSYIDGENGILEYRSIPIQTILQAADCNYLETAYLLIHGVFPDALELKNWQNLIAKYRFLHPHVIRTIQALPAEGHPMNALAASVAALGMAHQAADHTHPDAIALTTLRLMASFPSLIAAFHRARCGKEILPPKDNLDHASNFLWMLNGKVPTELERKVLDTVLIVHADHTLNASTFTARVAASTLSDTYMVLAAAISALNGPLHGGATEATLRQLRTIGKVENVRSWVEDKLARKEKIMGLGHRVYKVKDPRAPILQAQAGQLFAAQGRSPLYDVAMELEKIAVEKLGSKGVYPNVDFFSGLVYEKLGIPIDLFIPMFAMGRVAGWIAHLREQALENHLYRPEQIYTGSHEQKYIPLNQRPKIENSIWSKLK